MPLSILHTESSLGWGGQEIRVLTEAAGVARRGHDVLLAAPAQSRIFAEAAHFGVKARAVPIARKGARGVLAMRHLLAGHAFDVINTHSSTDTWLAALARASLRSAPPIVRTRHISAPLPHNRATRWLYDTATARIVTTGEKLRKQVIAETGVAAPRVVSIPTGIDLGRFHPADRREARAATGLAADAPIVGIVATLRSWKGHRYLFEAFAAMKRAPALLVVVGDGPQSEALQAYATELGIASQVRFAGNLPDVAPWMQSFDVFCLPSYANEGVPQALMQAMACGLPVVSTPVGSIEEIVEPGVTGILVAPRDAGALRVQIEGLLDNAKQRATLGSQAAARARERFGDALMVDRMLEVFAEAAKRG
ncbi:MAG TPA: glycosyltransferase family 4 protein [Usitatibacter sp.]|jgi:glycosyltransferase involved in cell wall biosynthesis